MLSQIGQNYLFLLIISDDNYRVVAHLENRGKSGKNIFNENVREIHEKLSMSRKNENVLANVLEIVEIAHFISIFCKRIRDTSVTFCYTARQIGVVEK